MLNRFHAPVSITADPSCEVDDLRAHRELNSGFSTSWHCNGHILARFEGATVCQESLAFLLYLDQVVRGVPIDLDAESLVFRRSHFLLELALELLVIS